MALFIAAVMFAMGYGAIHQALTGHETIKQQQDRMLEIQTAMRVIEQDFVQLAPRPIRAPTGYTWLPALVSHRHHATGGDADARRLDQSQRPAAHRPAAGRLFLR